MRCSSNVDMWMSDSCLSILHQHFLLAPILWLKKGFILLTCIMPHDIIRKEHLLERLARLWPISSLYGVSKSSAYFWKASNGALVASSSYAVHWTLILHYSHALFQLFLSNIPLFTPHSVTVYPWNLSWKSCEERSGCCSPLVLVCKCCHWVFTTDQF